MLSRGSITAMTAGAPSEEHALSGQLAKSNASSLAERRSNTLKNMSDNDAIKAILGVTQSVARSDGDRKDSLDVVSGFLIFPV